MILKRNNKTIISSLINVILMLSSGLILSGCTASSFNEMTKDSGYSKQEYTVNENYQSLYKRALSKARECHEQGMITAAMIAEGQIYSDLQKAELSIYLSGGLGKSFYHGAEFIAINNDSTTLIIYTKFGGNWFKILKNEFTGECTQCLCKDGSN